MHPMSTIRRKKIWLCQYLQPLLDVTVRSHLYKVHTYIFLHYHIVWIVEDCMVLSFWNVSVVSLSHDVYFTSVFFFQNKHASKKDKLPKYHIIIPINIFKHMHVATKWKIKKTKVSSDYITSLQIVQTRFHNYMYMYRILYNFINLSCLCMCKAVTIMTMITCNTKQLM